jgi:hypothetical protein
MTKTGKIVLGVAGGLFFLCVIVVSFGVWMFMSAFQTEAVDQAKATSAFDEVRRQFAGVPPAFEMFEQRAKVLRPPPATPAGPPPKNVRILVWNPHEGSMSRISVPFSLLKLSDDPVEFDNIALEVGDVERYGRTLLLDGDTRDGHHVLAWTD